MVPQNPLRKYIALFRGINVGGRNTLPMKALEALMQAEGYLDIRTYIQSGNLLFSSDADVAPDAIAQVVEDSFGFLPEVLLLDYLALEAAAASNPYAAAEGKACHFYFCKEVPGAPDIDGLSLLKAESESFQLKNAVLYLHAPDGIGRSKLAARVERSLGVPVTARNLNTVNKLLELGRSG